MAKKSAKSRRRASSGARRRKRPVRAATARGAGPPAPSAKTAGARKQAARRKAASEAGRHAAPGRAKAQCRQQGRAIQGSAREPDAGIHQPTAAPRAEQAKSWAARAAKRSWLRRPKTGRTRRGPTNPMPTKRSTGTASRRRRTRTPRASNAPRTASREIEEGVPAPPSSLDLDRAPSAARSGRQKLQESQQDHNETSPVMTGGDVDADWEDAYAVGDEAPGGDNPTPGSGSRRRHRQGAGRRLRGQRRAEGRRTRSPSATSTAGSSIPRRRRTTRTGTDAVPVAVPDCQLPAANASITLKSQLAELVTGNFISVHFSATQYRRYFIPPQIHLASTSAGDASNCRPACWSPGPRASARA